MCSLQILLALCFEVSQAELDAKKAKKTKLPDMGLSRAGQVGKGGTIGVSNGALLTQHVLKQQVRRTELYMCSYVDTLLQAQPQQVNDSIYGVCCHMGKKLIWTY